MAECPFCGSPVTSHLISHGGTCPRCLAEIPGEDAATDPGAEVRAARERHDRRWITYRNYFLSAGAIGTVSLAGIAAITLALWPKPEVAALLDFDTLDFPMPEVVASEAMAVVPNTNDRIATTAAPPRPGSRPSATSATRFAPGQPIGGGTAGASDLADARGAETTGTRSRSGTGDVSGPSLALSPAVGSRPAVDLSLKAPRVRRDDNLVLSDPDAIRQMIGEYMREQIPQLNGCYDRRLKVHPNLGGRWKLQFVVDRDGDVEDAVVEPIEVSDAELEACIVSHVEREWEFGKVAMNQPVSRTLRFQPPRL